MWLDEYRKQPHRLAELLFWDCAEDAPGVLLLKDNSLLAVIQYRGPDLYASEPAQLLAYSTQLNQLLKRFTGGWTLCSEAQRRTVCAYPETDWPDPVSRLLDDQRRALFLTPGQHFQTTTYLTLVYKKPQARTSWLRSMLYENLPDAHPESAVLGYFQEEVTRTLALLQATCPEATLLTVEETAPGYSPLLTYLHSTVSPKAHPVGVPADLAYLDSYLTDKDIYTGLYPSWGDPHDPLTFEGYIAAISPHRYPEQTYPGILDTLNSLPMEYRAVLRYIPLDTAAALKEIDTYRRRWRGASKSLRSVVAEKVSQEPSVLMEQAPLEYMDEATEAMAAVTHGRVSFGYTTQTIILWDRDLAVLDRKVKAVDAALTTAGCVAKVEDLNTFAAWRGTIPGDVYSNVRRPLLHSQNLAHLLPATAPWGGPDQNVHLGGPPLLRTTGDGQTPFNLDTYDGDVGMAYIAGPIGCHAPGSHILMADGTTQPVEVLAIGDRVMGPDSSPRTITALHHGIAPMVRIHPTKGEPFQVNLDHILALKRTNTGTSLDGGVVTLSVRDWLAKSPTFRGTHKLFRTGVDFPVAPPLPLPPYIVGVLLGDGSFTSPPSITNPDPAIREHVEKLAHTAGLQVCDRVGNDSCPRYSLKDLPWVRGFQGKSPLRLLLETLDLHGKTATSKHIPGIYKTASREDRLALLAGLLDTDGSLGSGCYDYISASPCLAYDLCFLARSVGLAAYRSRATKHCQTMTGHYWRVSISGDTHMIPCVVPRKQAPPRHQKKSVLVTGITVEPLGLGEYYGFECDGDHLYLMEDFTVTHNSGKSTLLATMAMHWLKYPGAEVKIIDTGQSLRCATYAMGGHWYDVAATLETHGWGTGKLDDADAKLWGAPWLPVAHPWQCFEMGDLLKTPDLLATVMQPLLQTLKDRMTGRPTLFIFDEGHLYLLHRVLRRGLDDYIRGVRKLNGAVVFATQSIADAAQSVLAPIISDSAMTRIYLANYHALEPETAKIYHGWGLQPRELQIIASMIPKREYYYQGRLGHRKFQLQLQPAELAFAGVSTKPALARMADLYKGNSVAFARDWLHEQGLHQEADTVCHGL